MTEPHYETLELRVPEEERRRLAKRVQSPGVRCPNINETLRMQCSRDLGHPDAHVSRAEMGPGLIAWHNDAATPSWIKKIRPSDDSYVCGSPWPSPRQGLVWLLRWLGLR
jgi:hypothetical protein